RTTSSSGASQIVSRVAATTPGAVSNSAPVDSASVRSPRLNTRDQRPSNRSQTAVATSMLLTRNQTSAATAYQATERPSSRAPEATPASRMTSPAAANATTYWAALNATRHGLWCRKSADTSTAAVCTTTAGPKPKLIKMANV